MSDKNSSHFGDSSSAQDDISSVSRESSSSGSSNKLEETRTGISVMAPIRHLLLGVKPKPLVKNKLPGVVTTQTVIPACKAKGKGQKCCNKPFEETLLKANKNIDALRDILETTNTDFISCWENSKDMLSQHERMNKDLEKHLLSIKKQLVVMEERPPRRVNN